MRAFKLNYVLKIVTNTILAVTHYIRHQMLHYAFTYRVFVLVCSILVVISFLIKEKKLQFLLISSDITDSGIA